jgi:hypothetical protein
MTTNDPAQDPSLPNANDPGGAHSKGYTAETGEGLPVPDNDPIPLADDVLGHVHKPTDALPPTGRKDPEEPEKGRIVSGGA